MDIDLVLAISADTRDIYDEERSPELLGVNLKEGAGSEMVFVPIMYLRGPKEEIREEVHKWADRIIDEIGWE